MCWDAERKAARDRQLLKPGGDKAKSIREVVLDEIDRVRRADLEPWFINIDADWWEQARRDWDERLDGPAPYYVGIDIPGDLRKYLDVVTYLGLPVRVYAPGSSASGGVRVHAYPRGWR